MKAIILAAGYATRLYPLTKEYPKPLLLVKDRPIIDFIVEKLAQIDAIDEIMVVTNSKFIRHFKQWRKGHPCSKKISLVDDLTKTKDDRRGAIGDMHFVIEKCRIQDDLLVLGGDNIFNTGLKSFLAFARKKARHPVIGVYDIKEKALASHYGIVRVNKNKQIIDFQEKPRVPHSTLVAMCLYYFPKDKIGLVREYMHARIGHHDAIGLYIDWLRNKEAVYSYVFSGSWYDIGHHDALKAAKQNFPYTKSKNR
jgi:glucose-1-phosphate thymidylyltransferase